MQIVNLTSRRIQSLAQSEVQPVVVLPIAAIEQHGPHLGVSTDTAIVTAIAESVEKALPETVLLCPTAAYGSSHHHNSFSGTVSLSPELFSRVLVELVLSLKQSGFRRIVLLNGHGGNITPARQALAILSASEMYGAMNVALATYWELAQDNFRGKSPMQTVAISHACEYETSLMLYLHPDRVDMDNIVNPILATSNAYVGWHNEKPYRGVTVIWRFEEMTRHGSSGRPDLATAEKGEHLFRQATVAVADFMKDFQKWPLPADLRSREVCGNGEGVFCTP